MWLGKQARAQYEHRKFFKLVSIAQPFVSVTINGASRATLKVFTPPHNDDWRKYRYGDHHNREFSNADAAWAFAFDRGYLKKYYAQDAIPRSIARQLRKRVKRKDPALSSALEAYYNSAARGNDDRR